MKGAFGFTLIEMLVVVTIIALISGTSSFYFIKYLEGKALERDIELFTDTISNLDHQVAVKQIGNYLITLKTDKGYIYSVNQDDGQKSFFSGSDFLTGKFTVANDISYPTTWTMKIFAGDKFQQKADVSSSDTFPLTFRNFQENIVESYLSGSLTNTLKAVYLSEDNLSTNISKHTRITQMNSQSDGLGVSYTTLYVENLNGRKTLSDGNTYFSQAYIFFQKGNDTATYLLKNQIGK